MRPEARTPDEPRSRETGRRPDAGTSQTAAPLEREIPVPASSVSPEEALEIGRDAYIYAFPLVLMEVTRRVTANVAEPKGPLAPMNQFANLRAFPDATFTAVVRPNADTLYSSLHFDVANEPLVIDVPDSAGRYYLLPMLDMWTDVFASPGKRTTGTATQRFAIVGPRWQGTLPPGVDEIRSPTPRGSMIGRTQTNGAKDYDAVHRFQDGLTVTPLSELGKGTPPAKGRPDPKLDMSAPGAQVAAMDPNAFWACFSDVVTLNAPHPNDYPILERLGRLGVVQGRRLDVPSLVPAARKAMEEGCAAGHERILAATPRTGRVVNHWQIINVAIGTYGTDYLRRAVVAYAGLGANLVEDAIYPTAFLDAEGKPLDSAAPYVIHFAKGQLPPANAFWSVTMYDNRQLFTANPINRFAIGDRNNLQLNADGSLDLYLQRESPGKDKENNWLPTPANGPFSLTLRLYWPKPEAFDGRWAPPPIQRVS